MGRFVKFNPNPKRNRVGDCAIRAVSKATGMSWDKTYAELSAQGYSMADMPSANNVWGAFLRKNGFVQRALPENCPDCYTLNDFCEEHPKGLYVVALPNHVVTAHDGLFYDSWDSGDEQPIYYWQKKEDKK